MAALVQAKNPFLPRSLVVRIGLIVSLCALAGCDSSPTPAANRSPAATVDDRLNARVIGFKNQLQSDPYSADARLGLGLVLLELSNPRAAEAELARAVELGMDPNQAVPPLLRTWNLLGRSKDVIATHGATRLSRPDSQAELLAELAVARAKTGNAALAREHVAQALQLDPASVSARLVEAKIELSDGKVDEALNSIDRALSGTGRKVDAWDLKGDVLLLVKRDVPGGQAAYEEALKVSPRYLPVWAKLVMLSIDRNELAEARKQLVQLERVAEGSPPALYLAARLAVAGGDLTAAKAQIARALSEYPKDLRSLILGAEIELKSGSLRTAEEHLANALTLAPAMPRIRYLLAQTFMRSGAPDKAEMILEPLLRAKAPDPTALGLSAEAALQAGLTLKSMRLFERAAAAEPGNPRYRTAVALNRIAKGDIDGGFSELESVAQSHPSIYTDLALLSARLQQGDYKAAERAAIRLVAKQPNRALPYLILGRLKVQARDTATARLQFEKALELDRSFVPAALGLANLDMQEGAYAAAKKHFEQVLQHAPNSLEAQMALIDIQRQSGEPAERITASLEAVIRQHPGFAMPRIALVNHLILAASGTAALQVAQAAAGQFPEDIKVMDTLGRAQVAANESAQALTTFRRIVSLRPRAPEPLLRMADVYAGRNEIDSAIEHYKQALVLSPDLIEARIKLVGYETVKKNWRDALYGARKVQIKLPKDPAGFHLEGLVYAAQQQWEPAIAAFKAALQRGVSSEVATQLHKTYLQANRRSDADRLASDWVKSRPRDGQFIGYLGEVAVARRDYAAAEAHFRTVVANEEKNARALNNLAWVLLNQRKPGAVDIARRAHALEPTNANVMDTLATALADVGRDAEALAMQKQAVALAPKMQFLRLGLARLAIKTKDYPLARVNLDQLSALGKEFPAQTEVWKLRQELR